MYQTLAIAQTQAAYESPSASYMHSNPNSPVYVPTSRVGPMIPSLPYLQPTVSSQPSHGVSSHPVWSQATPESPSYSAGSPHTSSRFHYSPSPPMNNGTSRDSGYSNPLNSNSRDQYLPRPISGSYASPYSSYVGPQLPQLSPAWPAAPFDNSMLHSLQTRGPQISIRPGPGDQINV
uniref:GATA binding protein 6 n=1 Tax=Astyanax mexicanus TaxID=7994 RepID=A0A8B9JEZ4_ASTMX